MSNINCQPLRAFNNNPINFSGKEKTEEPKNEVAKAVKTSAEMLEDTVALAKEATGEKSGKFTGPLIKVVGTGIVAGGALATGMFAQPIILKNMSAFAKKYTGKLLSEGARTKLAANVENIATKVVKPVGKLGEVIANKNSDLADQKGIKAFTFKALNAGAEFISSVSKGKIENPSNSQLISKFTNRTVGLATGTTGAIVAGQKTWHSDPETIKSDVTKTVKEAAAIPV